MLECADSSLYTGITTDLLRRLREHRGEGGRGAKYTQSHGPVSLKAAWSAPDRATASRLEYKIKALKREQKLKLILGEAPRGFDFGEAKRIELPLAIKNPE